MLNNILFLLMSLVLLLNASYYERANDASKTALQNLDCEFEDCTKKEILVPVIKEKVIYKEKIIYRDREPMPLLQTVIQKKIITNPTTVQGYPVDRCYTWATNCDKPVADKICRDAGYEYSIKSTWEHKNPTQLLSGAICKESYCGAITYIECVRKATY